MARLGIWTEIFVRLPLLVACALGLLLALSLLARRRDAAVWLGIIGFSMLLASQLFSLLMNVLPIWQIAGADRPLGWGLYCLRVTLQLSTAGGILCIALAFWIGANHNAAPS